MALNTIEYAGIFQRELDRQIIEGATSGWMEANAGQVIYNGGKEIKIPTLSTQGLVQYNRDTGYVDGAVTFEYETHFMAQDRGRRFRLDAMDMDETGFALTAAKIAEEFQRTKVIPEIDAYRYSTLSGKAGINDEYVPDSETIFAKLIEQLNAVLDLTGDEDEPVISISRPVYNILMSAPQVLNIVENGSFKQGEIDLNVKRLNGAILIPVPSARMFTEYTFNAENEGGFNRGDSARNINWIITPKNAPIAVSRTDNIKIITPEQNQFADAWDIDYRKYHDLFVPDNKISVIAVSLESSD